MQNVCLLVEGLHDKDKVLEVFPEAEVIVTYSRINGNVRNDVNSAKVRGKLIIILTDPDKTGDEHAERLFQAFNLPRIRPSEEQCEYYKGIKKSYGVEHMSNENIYKLLTNGVKLLDPLGKRNNK